MILSRLLILLIVLAVMVPKSARAAVVFEDNFDAITFTFPTQGAIYEDWYVGDGQTDQMLPSSYPGISTWDGTWIGENGVATTNVERQVTTNAARGGGGKGLRYTLEATGTWAGGRITLVLPASYSELYVKLHARYQAGFDFGDAGHGQQKFLVIQSWPNAFAKTSANGLMSRGSTYWPKPTVFWDWYHNFAFGTTRISTYERGACPGYGGSGAPACTGVSDNDTAVNWPSDGGWHHYEMRVKLNSQPGVSDGEWEIWIDGVSVASASDVRWVDSVPWVSGRAYVSAPSGGAGNDRTTVIPLTTFKGFRALANHTAGGKESCSSTARSSPSS